MEKVKEILIQYNWIFIKFDIWYLLYLQYIIVILL